MVIGTQDKKPHTGIYSAANNNFAAHFQTMATAASRQTTGAVDHLLRNKAPL